MSNLKLTIEYDGTDYSGWQSQRAYAHDMHAQRTHAHSESAAGVVTIEGTLTKAINKVLSGDVKLIGASRTDAGVHALGQVANFHINSDIDSEIDVTLLRRSLNNIIPDDIVIKNAELAHKDFDARRDALSKTYIYRIYNAIEGSPMELNRSWFIHRELDLGAMEESLKYFIGEHDFSAFRGGKSGDGHSIKEVLDLSLNVMESSYSKEGKIFEFTIRGTAFLRFMIRFIIATVVRVGRGTLTPKEIEDLLESSKQSRAYEAAPGCGLFLKEIEY